MSARTILCATVSHTALAAGLAMAVAVAQDAVREVSGAAYADAGVISLPQVDVQGTAPANTLQRGNSLDRLPGTVQSTP